MLKDFKEFALKGNMVDMAVGIIIGAAFGTVVKSVVDDILMPVVATVFNAPDFSNLFTVLRNPTGETFTSIAAAREGGAAVLGYGLFINALIAFLIVAFVLFMVVKQMNKLKKEAPAAPPEPSAEEKVLKEIRDLLAKRA
ncbi:MAG: large conductance mechanosensitive channel protein MscL [Gemmatimonadales bacterium]|nr:MAG: large conductance mechanosensitive channel protein MscL [Gemmatimonadales bacterium]